MRLVDVHAAQRRRAHAGRRRRRSRRRRGLRRRHGRVRRRRRRLPGGRGGVRSPTATPSHPLAEVKLLAPLVPPTILNSGQNYWDHRDEKPEVDQKEPEFFLKAPLAVIGPDEPVILDPIVTKKLDYEVELAVVIGKAGRHIPVEKALDHVFGYTVANDITARDRQAVPHPQGGFEYALGPGKNFDTSAPLGPVDRDARRDRRPAGAAAAHVRERGDPPEQLDREDDLVRRRDRRLLLALLHAAARARHRDGHARRDGVGDRSRDRRQAVRPGRRRAAATCSPETSSGSRSTASGRSRTRSSPAHAG